MWQINYSYDGVELGDLFSISSGLAWGKERNSVRSISFSVSLRKLYEWCQTQDFDITRMFTPIKSTVKIVQQTSPTVSGTVVGGWLSQTPAFSFGNSADASVLFTFSTYLGLTAGAYIKPPYSYNDNFNDVAQYQIERIVERTIIAGAPWPISPGTSDVLAVVSDVLEAPKSLKDFLLERADNTTGTGSFDVYDDPDGVITLYEKYGVDISSEVTFSYPDMGGKYDVKTISFPEWSNFVSDVFLTGAGNGYATTSGAEGAAIFSTATNDDTIANTGYWEIATSESDISVQAVLDDKATSYVKNTDMAFVTPTITLDGDRFLLYDHDQGGDLWLGDSVFVDATGWTDPLLPLVTPIKLRINSIDATINQQGHCDLSLGMVIDD